MFVRKFLYSSAHLGSENSPQKIKAFQQKFFDGPAARGFELLPLRSPCLGSQRVVTCFCKRWPSQQSPISNFRTVDDHLLGGPSIFQWWNYSVGLRFCLTLGSWGS